MLIRATGLSHTFPGVPALLDGLSFELPPGSLTALTGPSGSGKSTLLSILAGWLTPTAGSVERDGIGKVGWVFQNPLGVAHRSALDHVVLPIIAKGTIRETAEHRALEIMDAFGLAGLADREFSALSGGEAQRLMLARGVAVSPELLLIDEPTAQLDVHTAETVNRVLGSLARPDMIVVVATHSAQTRDACNAVIDLAVGP
jgi:putative ABC transport system ATP-binding protein